MMKTLFEKLELLLEFNQDLTGILEEHFSLIDRKLMLDEKYKKEIEEIKIINHQFLDKIFLKDDFLLYIKMRKIQYGFLCEYYTLSWRLSFLLRSFK